MSAENDKALIAVSNNVKFLKLLTDYCFDTKAMITIAVAVMPDGNLKLIMNDCIDENEVQQSLTDILAQLHLAPKTVIPFKPIDNDEN